jgi:DNA-binding CsgD family transcriptional regulator/tetratricopeptide (TPR) repeat protein
VRPPPDAARRALDGREWGHAYRLLSDRAGAGTLSVDELDWLATAAYLTGRDEEAFHHWSEAHRSALAAGDARRAARLGYRIGSGMGFKGDVPRLSGWVARVRRVLEAVNVDCVEHGYLELGMGFCRLFEAGDVPGAREFATRAAKVADRFGDVELRTVAGLLEARCVIYLGDLAEGLGMLDEAMVAVENDELSSVVAGDAYCTAIDACHELFDVRRCEVWSAAFVAWCDAQPDLVLYRGHCLLHQAELLQLHGRWADGAAFARQACQRLSEPLNRLVLGGAHYVEAELHRLRAEFDQAEEAYQRAHMAGCDPHPGLALLRLAQGHTDVAVAAARRALAQAEGPIGRARVLGPSIEILLAAGDVAAAEAAGHELAALAGELGSRLLDAQACQMRGAALLAMGDGAGALTLLGRALSGWIELDAPYDAARTRLLVAAACEALGDHEGARMERAAANVVLESLGAGAGSSIPRPLPGGLSPREAEVLALVARGGTNRAIAEQLFISEKTVTSHLTHVFAKLGVTSRAAATAFAYEHGLAGRPT